MPPEAKEFLSLMVAFTTATSQAARTAAWGVAIQYLVKNPRVYAQIGGHLGGTVILAVERELLALFAAKGLQRGAQAVGSSGMRLYMARLGMNLAAGPKIPMPQAQLALTIAIALGTCGQAVAESKGRESRIDGYQQYLTVYMLRIAKIVSINPNIASRLAEPQTFDQWYAENQ